MKKKEMKLEKVVAGKKEKMTLEKLAIMMARGFENMATKTELFAVKEELSEVKDVQASLEEESKDTNRRVVSIERKLSGMLMSLDETVHRNEFKKLERRVEALEA